MVVSLSFVVSVSDSRMFLSSMSSISVDSLMMMSLLNSSVFVSSSFLELIILVIIKQFQDVFGVMFILDIEFNIIKEISVYYQIIVIYVMNEFSFFVFKIVMDIYCYYLDSGSVIKENSVIGSFE